MIEFELKTVRNPIKMDGVGLHSGGPVALVVHPFEGGIRFRCKGDEVEAHPDNVSKTPRCTVLGPIAVIEHLMSALAGMEVTDALVELSTPELPALGGGAGEYCEALVGQVVTCGRAQLEGPFARVYMKHEDIQVSVAAGEGHWRYEYSSRMDWIGKQSFEAVLNPEVFCKEIAPARTFAYEDEVEAIRASGMGKGLDERSALILGEAGYVNAPLFSDEPARHKLLDLIGDLYLTGVPIRLLNVSAERSGHTANVQAARKLSQAVRIVR